MVEDGPGSFDFVSKQRSVAARSPQSNARSHRARARALRSQIEDFKVKLAVKSRDTAQSLQFALKALTMVVFVEKTS